MLRWLAVALALALTSAIMNVLTIARSPVSGSHGLLVLAQIILFSTAATFVALAGSAAWLSRVLLVGALGAGVGVMLEWWLLSAAVQIFARDTVFVVGGPLSERLLIALWLASLAAAGSAVIGWLVVRISSWAAA
jgi:hypothetical protein